MTPPPQPTQLNGQLVTLEPLGTHDAAALLPSASDPEVWRWKLVPRPTSLADMEHLISQLLLGPGRWPFTISRRTDGQVIGSTTLANFDWHHRSVEMGFTWLDRSAWGQGYNEDSKLLLLSECFDDLELQRVEWQVDSQNTRSVAALTRLGFHHEGTLRSRHVRPDGTRRDSHYFSVLRREWPACRARLVEQIHQRAATAAQPDLAPSDSPLTPDGVPNVLFEAADVDPAFGASREVIPCSGPGGVRVRWPQDGAGGQHL